MVRILILLLGITLDILPCVGHANESKLLPLIKITPNVWGGAKTEDIYKVLMSTARQFLPHFNQEEPFIIKVNRSKSGPIILYKRGASGEYIVLLNTEKQFWSQYAFQFGHEIGHIICGYKKGDQSNLWFEETLCEAASLFALRGMTKEWKKKPPYPNWKSYGREFAKYAKKRINKYPWPKEQSLEDWFKERKHTLIKEPANRGRNVRLASKLLPFFEEEPMRWGACAFINVKKSDKKRSFLTYLKDWRMSCPERAHQNFVDQLAHEFGIILSLNK